MSLPTEPDAIAAWIEAELDRADAAAGTAWHARALGMTPAEAVASRGDRRVFNLKVPRTEGDLVARAALRRGITASRLLRMALVRWMITEEGIAPEELPWLSR